MMGRGYNGDNYSPNAAEFYRGLRAGGAGHYGAVGFLGNFQEEGSLNPRAYNAKEQAGGVAQWRGDRFTNLQNFANKEGMSWDSPFLQGKFAATEMQNNYPQSWARLQNAESNKDVAGAASAVMSWEKPKGYNIRTGDTSGIPSSNDRIGHANAFNSMFGNSQPGAYPQPDATVQGPPMPPAGFLAGGGGGDNSTMQTASTPAPTAAQKYSGGLLGALGVMGDASGTTGVDKSMGAKLGDVMGGGNAATAMKGIAGLLGSGTSAPAPVAMAPAPEAHAPDSNFMSMLDEIKKRRGLA